MDLTPELTAQFAVAETLTRPTLSALLIEASYSIQRPPYSINQGNSDLKPMTAWNTDAALTWHRGSNFLSIALYQKSVSNLLGNGVTLFDGLGVQANYSRTNHSNPDSDSITYNLVGFYKKGPIQVRVAYNWLNAQDPTRNTVTVNGNSVQNDEFQAAYGELDASIQYTIAKNYFLFAQALNLNNEISVKYWGTPDRIEDYEGYGRRFGFGVRVKF